MRRQWLVALLGTYAGIIMSMAISNNFSWSPLIWATAAVGIYFALQHYRIKRSGTPETDERVEQNLRNAALRTLLILIGLGVLALAVFTRPDQQIPVKYIWVALLVGLFVLSAVLANVRRK